MAAAPGVHILVAGRGVIKPICSLSSPSRKYPLLFTSGVSQLYHLSSLLSSPALVLHLSTMMLCFTSTPATILSFSMLPLPSTKLSSGGDRLLPSFALERLRSTTPRPQLPPPTHSPCPLRWRRWRMRTCSLRLEPSTHMQPTTLSTSARRQARSRSSSSKGC